MTTQGEIHLLYKGGGIGHHCHHFKRTFAISRIGREEKFASPIRNLKYDISVGKEFVEVLRKYMGL